jgi:hypothetical protein
MSLVLGMTTRCVQVCLGIGGFTTHVFADSPIEG